MSPAVRVALIGFTPFERAHLEAGLKAVREGAPVFALTEELAACSLAIVDADHEAAVAAVVEQGRLAGCLMLGGTPRRGAWAQLPRPIQLPQLLRLLDGMARAAPPMSPAVQRVQDDLARLQQPQAARRPKRRPRLDHILVVDDSDTVLRFMAEQLARFGFQAHLAHGGVEALERVARRHFEFVFLATGMDGLDGFHTCRLIKRNPYPHPRKPPTVVLMLSDDAPVLRLRAEQADADSWLIKPLHAEPLLRVVGEREVRLQAEAQTTRAATTVM